MGFVITYHFGVPVYVIPIHYRILLLVFYFVLFLLLYRFLFGWFINRGQGVEASANVSLLLAFLLFVLGVILLFVPGVTLLPSWVHLAYVLMNFAIIILSLVFSRRV
jgi:hypothetical protein